MRAAPISNIGDLRIVSTFGIRISEFRRVGSGGFTILELLIVMSIIIILAGLTIGTMGYVQNKGRRSRAEAEIAAMSAALENYKADNGVYPRDTPGNGYTDALDARSDGSAGSKYQSASQYLYGQLSGDFDYNGTPEAANKSYFAFKPQMLAGVKDPNGNFTTVTYIQDPFGGSYGYSTAGQSGGGKGYNPTFDLWSIGAPPAKKPGKGATDQSQWIKNW